MSILRRVNDHNNTLHSFERIADYIVNKPYTDWDNNVGVVGCRKDSFLKDMIACKQAYHKNAGKMYDHSVLSITPDNNWVSDDVYMEIGRRIASHRIGYQCVFALHKDTATRHLHFLFNSVSYKDGKKFSQGPTALNDVKTFVNHVLEGYDFDPIKTGMLGCIDNSIYDIRNGFIFLEIEDDSADDRNLFVQPPPDEHQYNNPDAPIPGLNKFLRDGQSIINNTFGGQTMNRKFYPYKATTPYTPATSKATRSFIPQQDGGQDINLINVNNIHLNNNNDFATAKRDISEAFCDNAKASAEAMAILQNRGCKANINLTTINNYYLAGNNPMSSNNIIDGQFSEVNNTSAFSSPTYYPAPPYGNNFNPYGNGGCPPMQIDW